MCSVRGASRDTARERNTSLSASPWSPTPFPNSLPAPVAEKTKEQASHLGGAVFSGAGNIAAATGLMKKEEFPTDLKVSYPLAIHTHTCQAYPYTCHQAPPPPASLRHPLPEVPQGSVRLSSE